MTSAQLIKKIRERFTSLGHKNYHWNSFFNGSVDGYFLRINETKNRTIAMTEKEKGLLEIARLVIARNKSCVLTGSLLLSFTGIQKREAQDIDIVVKVPILEAEGSKGSMWVNQFWLPEGFAQATPFYEGESNSVSFKNSFGTKIDFLYSPDEECYNFKHLPCGNILRMIDAKIAYSKQDNPQAKKHKEDLNL